MPARLSDRSNPVGYGVERPSPTIRVVPFFPAHRPNLLIRWLERQGRSVPRRNHLEQAMNEILVSHPQIPSDEVTLLWHDHFWDGPLSGLCIYRGARYYFRFFEESDDGPWYRRFALYGLTPEQLSEEEAWHELFRQKVGTHWEPGGSLKPRELHHEFYDAYSKWKQPNYEEVSPIVGWFER